MRLGRGATGEIHMRLGRTRDWGGTYETWEGCDWGGMRLGRGGAGEVRMRLGRGATG